MIINSLKRRVQLKYRVTALSLMQKLGILFILMIALYFNQTLLLRNHHETKEIKAQSAVFCDLLFIFCLLFQQLAIN